MSRLPVDSGCSNAVWVFLPETKGNNVKRCLSNSEAQAWGGDSSLWGGEPPASAALRGGRRGGSGADGTGDALQAAAPPLLSGLSSGAMTMVAAASARAGHLSFLLRDPVLRSKLCTHHG